MPRGVHSNTSHSRKSSGAKVHRNYLIHNDKYGLSSEDNPFVIGGYSSSDRPDLEYRYVNYPSFFERLQGLASSVTLIATVTVGLVAAFQGLKALISSN